MGSTPRVGTMIEPAPGQGELRALTGIRGVAACFVVAYHYFLSMAATGPVKVVLGHGYIAVDLFFVLSGFVMARTYAPAFREWRGLRPYAAFLVKRLGRTYPLYITVLCLTGALLRTERSPYTGLEWASNAAMVQAWGLADSIVSPSWSISTELFAYIIFPLLTSVFLFGQWWRTVLASSVAFAILVFVATRPNEALNQLVSDAWPGRNGPLDVYGAGTAYLVLRCLAGFSLGLLCNRLAGRVQIAAALGRPGVADALMAVLAVLLLVPNSDVAMVLLFVPLIIALCSPRSVSSKVLGGGVVYWLGVVSYSIYLVHVLVQELARTAIDQVLVRLRVPHAYTMSGICTFALTLLVAAVTFHTIEKPGRTWSRRLLTRRPPPPILTEPSAP